MTAPAGVHFREEADLTWLGVPLASGPPLSAGQPASLARLAEDPGTPPPVRLAAGAVLSVCGDPRTPAVPAVGHVPGGRARIGLPACEVDEVVARWRHAGVNHPVAGIAAQDADAYVTWLAGLTGHPYRLPAEAEWEWAAGGPGRREYPWGNDFDPARANTREAGIHTTTPVGVFPAGAGRYGHLDLAGNVEEYTSGCYRPYPGGNHVADHLSQRLGSYRVTRGGSFARHGDLARTRRRHGAFPGPLYPCGFRVATSLPPPQSPGSSDDQGN